MRFVKFPHAVVWAMDALDQFPRHQARLNFKRADGYQPDSTQGQNNFLFGDGRVQIVSWQDYEFAPDAYGAPAPFYNWGHYYP